MPLFFSIMYISELKILSLIILSILGAFLVPSFLVIAKWCIRSRVARLLLYILILLLFCFTVSFTVFSFVVTNKGGGRVVSGRGYEEYRLGDYSNWMQKRVEKSSKWNKIKRHLQDAKVCKCLAVDSLNEVAEEFYKKKLSPIQSGCCKPPTSCNFLYVNATYWTSTAGNSTDVDCSRWSNDWDQLCYSCNSCKAGVLEDSKNHLREIGLFVFLVLFGLMVAILCSGARASAKEGEIVVP